MGSKTTGYSVQQMLQKLPTGPSCNVMLEEGACVAADVVVDFCLICWFCC